MYPQMGMGGQPMMAPMMFPGQQQPMGGAPMMYPGQPQPSMGGVPMMYPGQQQPMGGAPMMYPGQQQPMGGAPMMYPGQQQQMPSQMMHPGRAGHAMFQQAIAQAPVAQVACPLCKGKGALGKFGPCMPGDVHFLKTCPACSGSTMIPSTFKACPGCEGKGGKGTFGPVEFGSVHFKGPCDVCSGRAFINPQVAAAQAGTGRYFGGSGEGTPCPKCEGKGGIGGFGPCEPSSVHFKEKCPTCAGVKQVFRPLTKCPACEGAGGTGTFGPAAKYSVHYKGPCPRCGGRCYL